MEGEARGYLGSEERHTLLAQAKTRQRRANNKKKKKPHACVNITDQGTLGKRSTTTLTKRERSRSDCGMLLIH
jgi:hypothetical protein